jgi:hypothetical protein
MWEQADQTLVPVLVLAGMEIGEAFMQAMDVMGQGVSA